MKILIIGNSHTAMFAEAVQDGIAADHEITFFAQAGKGPVGANLEDGVITAEDPKLMRALSILGMPAKINLADFDAVAVVGMTLSSFTTVSKTQKYRILGWQTDDKPPAASWRTPVSEAFLFDAAQDAMLKSQAFRYLSFVRTATDCPVAMIAQPMPSEHILTVPKWSTFAKTADWGEGRYHMDLIRRVLRSTTKDFENIHHLEQPDDTTVHDFLTKDRFRKGAKRLNIKHTQDQTDVLHANAEMGRIMTKRLFNALNISK